VAGLSGLRKQFARKGLLYIVKSREIASAEEVPLLLFAGGQRRILQVFA